jgi:hypothetical protein
MVAVLMSKVGDPMVLNLMFPASNLSLSRLASVAPNKMTFSPSLRLALKRYQLYKVILDLMSYALAFFVARFVFSSKTQNKIILLVSYILCCVCWLWSSVIGSLSMLLV